MKKILLVVFIFLFHLNAFSQWNYFNAYGVGDCRELHKFNDNFYYGGCDQRFIKSTNSGNTWSNVNIAYTIYSVHFTSLNNGIAGGIYFTGNNYVIIKTSNGGNNWTQVTGLYYGGFPSYINKVLMVNGSLGFAVGNRGVVFKTTDGGSNWAVSYFADDQDELIDLYFHSADTGFIASDKHIYSTTDGGVSWDTLTTETFPINNFSFISHDTGYAVGGGQVMQTTDGGLTWQSLSLIIPINYHGEFVSTDTAYFGTNFGIQRTTDNFQSWELFDTNDAITDIEFYGSDTAFAAGDSHQALYTYNGGSPSQWQPLPDFSNGTANQFCIGVPIYFINESNNTNWSYTWLMNGVPFATTYNASYTPTVSGQTITISLVANNGFASDTLSHNYYINPMANPPSLSATVYPTYFCDEDEVNFTINGESGTTYTLWCGNTPVDFDYSTFSSTVYLQNVNVDSTSELCILATKNTICGSLYDTLCFTILDIAPIMTLQP